MQILSLLRSLIACLVSFISLEQLKDWYNADKKKLDIAKPIKDSELRAVATQIEADIKNNKFANEMGWDGEFWKVWESNKGNKHVNLLLSNYIGLVTT